VRVVTALALVVVNLGLGWSLAAGPAAADAVDDSIKRFPISECYTVTVNAPDEFKPSVTVCEP
jgi:hypothetical protein